MPSTKHRKHNPPLCNLPRLLVEKANSPLVGKQLKKNLATQYKARGKFEPYYVANSLIKILYFLLA